MIIAHKAQLSSQDCASIRILYSEKEGRYELFDVAFIRTRTCRTYRLFRRCVVLKCEKLRNCALIRPFDSHQMLIKQKDISQGYVFLFGTPIGNRTLVSAVRGRRLEPLDHEGKSILLCDNSIIFVHTQAKIDNLRIFYLMNFLIKNYQLHIDFYYLIM